VLPFDPIKKRILLLKQFRAGSLKRNHDPTMVEIVAGIIDVDESPAKATRREFLEETGCLVKNF